MHNERLSFIQVRSLRIKGKNPGIWVEVFCIPRLNDLVLPTRALFHFFCLDHQLALGM